MFNRTLSNVLVFILSLATMACSETGPRYENLERLERPPEVSGALKAGSTQEIVDPVITRLSIQQGMGDKVSLDKNTTVDRLIIREPFEKAWFIMELLLNQLRLEVSDRNRDQGVYYLRYDPDDSEKTGFLTWLWTSDDYAERTYALQLSAHDGMTAVTASIAAEIDEKNAREHEPAFDDARNDGPNRLLQMLFLKLRDGIPKHQRQN